MKTAKKLLILALVVLMCLSTLVACGGGDETTATTTTTTTTTDPAGPGPGPATIDWTQYSGRECVFYFKNEQYFGQSTLYIKEDEVGTNQADIATLARLEFFEEKTGIQMTGVRSAAQSNYDTILPLINANDPENLPDLFFISGSDAMKLTFNNKLVALNDPATPNMDFSKDCWHANINNNLAIWGNYYAVSGYFDTANAERACAMFFDRDALETINPATIDFQTYPELAGYIGEDTLYSWAENGEWTWDKAIALAKLFAGPDGTYVGNIPAKNGIEYGATDAIWLMSSVDLKPFQEDDNLVPTLHLGTEALEKLNYLHQNVTYDGGSKYANFRGNPYDSSADSLHPTLFGTNHTALFTCHLVNRLQSFSTYSTETVSFRYGILPMPKYSEQQDNYFSYAGQWFTLTACIPSAVEDIGFSTFVLQHFTEMGKEKFHTSVKTVYEAVIEDGLSGRYAGSTDQAENDKKMLGIVMDSADAWIWEYAESSLGTSGGGPGSLSLLLNTSHNPNFTSFNDTHAPVIRQTMYTVLITLGLAEEA